MAAKRNKQRPLTNKTSVLKIGIDPRLARMLVDQNLSSIGAVRKLGRDDVRTMLQGADYGEKVVGSAIRTIFPLPNVICRDPAPSVGSF